MKQKIALLLCSVLLFCGGVATASDFGGLEGEEAVRLLADLGILTLDGGNIKPDQLLTRGEMAALAVRLSGAPESRVTAEDTLYTDVDASHWAAGYIKTARSLGLLDGYPDGSFRPEEGITYDQAVAVIVKLLGYGPVAEREGGYPQGYRAALSLMD